MAAATSVKLVISSQVQLIDLVHSASEKMAEYAGFDADEALNVGLAVREAVINAIIHGNKQDPKLKVDVTLTVEARELKAKVRDYGEGFDPDATPDPTINNNIMKTSGRGLLLINPISPFTRRPAALEALHRPAVRRLAVPIVRHYRHSLTRYILTRRVYADPRSVTEATVRKYAGYLDARENIEALLRVVADWRPAELAAYDTRRAEPLLLVTGRGDRRAPPADVCRWAARLGGACVVLEDCAHGVPEEAPDRVVQMILELDRTPPNGRTDGR